MNKYNYINEVDFKKVKEYESKFERVELHTSTKKLNNIRIKFVRCFNNGQLLCEAIVNKKIVTPIKTQKALLHIGYNGITTIKI
jgi:hypothetical protein